MRWIALNSTAYSDVPSESMRNLFEYVQKGTSSQEDELVRAIDEAVDEANHDRRWVDMVFSVSTIEEDIRREARYRIEMAEKQGIEQGETRRNALVKALLDDNRLEDLRKVSEDPSLRIGLYEEYNLI